VQEQVEVGLVPVQLHRHRVDQERHVVGDDVDDRLNRPEGGDGRTGAGRAGIRFGHLDQGPALRALRGQRRVRGGHGGQLVTTARHKVLGGHVPVVGPEEAGHIADGRAHTSRFRCRGLRRPIEGAVPCLVHSVRHRCLSPGVRVRDSRWAAHGRLPAMDGRK
jgi:hypothetical protein